MSDVRKIVLLALHNGAALKEPDLQEVLAKIQSLADSSLVADLLADQSPELLVHGDYHMGNLLVSGENIQGVVDYEEVRLQGQSYDLGYAALMLCLAPTGESPAPLDAKSLQHFSDGYFSNTRHTPFESDIIVACALVSSWLLERAPSWEDKPSALSYLQRTIGTWSYYARSITGAQ
jgi:Ser/Thr protein kinase RdoA (MazF antagonist)